MFQKKKRNPTVKMEYVQLWLAVKLRALGKAGDMWDGGKLQEYKS